MTTYDTIPTFSSSKDSSHLDYISRARDRIKFNLTERSHWRQMLDYHAIGIPSSFHEALARLTTNLAYFKTNYAPIILLIMFLSLLWHPISLIVSVVIMAVWLFLYFLRDEPLVVFGRTMDDRLVLGVLSVLMLVFLFFTKATVNILVVLLIGMIEKFGCCI